MRQNANRKRAVPETIPHIQDLINHGRYFEAMARAQEAIKVSDEPRLKQLYALAVSKSGSPQLALDFLTAGNSVNPDDPETAGILGGVYKELFKKQQDSKYAILSRDTYAKNFSITKSYYTGINAATMSAIAGRAVQGREIATSVISLIEGSSTDFWELATLGEAYLLTKNRERSIEFYIKARQQAANDWGKVLSVHNQLWLLNHYVPVPKDVLRIFAPPEVVAFAGHMVDAPNRKTPRFPSSIQSKVKEAIRGAIRTLHASIGYCSLASGADILFAEAMAEEGGEVHILMPFAKSDFIHTSLNFAGEEWVERFEKLLVKFPINYVIKDHYGGNDDLFSLLGKVIFGSAILRSQTYHQEPFLLTVLSEFDLKQKEGGTRDTIQMWPYPQKHTNINPDTLYIAKDIVPSASGTTRAQLTEIPNRPVLYMACIEWANVLAMERERIEKLIYSYAGEQQLSFKVFIVQPDSIVFAHDTEIALMDIVKSVWTSTAPFKPVKPIRVGLHAAPVYVNSTDNDVNIKSLRAISQYATAGSICSSGGFAAALALHPKKFQLDYVGVIQLPNGSESSGLYKVGMKG